MLKLYYYDAFMQDNVSIHEPLHSTMEQALELFEMVNTDVNSYMGIISENENTVQFSKYNKFVWNVEIPHKTKKGSYHIFLTPLKVKQLIIDLYSGFNPLKINGLMFENKE